MKALEPAFDEIFRSVNSSDAPGVVVAVAQRGKVIYRKGFGLASIEHGVMNTPATRMRIGSTSKHFTCLAVLLLAEEGKLDIDAGARRYLPELPLLEGEPTLRQFMTHSSGYRCFLDLGFLANGMAMVPNGGALAAQVRQRAANFTPGSRMIYCNGGYHLLSEAIERVSGMAFEHFMKERVFEPLDMIDTESIPSDMEIHPRLATLHIQLPDGRYRRGIFPTEENRGEGAMVSTVDDMLRWLAHLRGSKRVGRESTWLQLLEVARMPDGQPSTYAMGLFRHLHRGVEVIHHPGSVLGGSSQMLTVPEHELDIVILCNGAAAKPATLAYKLVDSVLDGHLGEPETMASADGFGHLIGQRYHSYLSGALVGFETLDDGKLGLSIMNEPGMALRDDGSGLGLGFEDAGLGPIRIAVDELGRATRDSAAKAPEELQVNECTHTERFTRIAPESASAMRELESTLVGRYRSEDLESDALVARNGDRLELKVFGPSGTAHMSLQPLSNRVYGVKALDPALPLCGALTMDLGGQGIESFRISTARTRNLLFKRIGP